MDDDSAPETGDSPDLVEELRRTLREADADDEVRAIVLTGSGRAFSAGFDMAKKRETPPTTEALVTSAVEPTAGWISLGRDLALEAKIINELQCAIDGALPLPE